MSKNKQKKFKNYDTEQAWHSITTSKKVEHKAKSYSKFPRFMDFVKAHLDDRIRENNVNYLELFNAIREA